MFIPERKRRLDAYRNLLTNKRMEKVETKMLISLLKVNEKVVFAFLG